MNASTALRLSHLLKRANTASTPYDQVIQSMMGPGSYGQWLGPQVKEIADPTQTTPGLLKSLGYSAMGTLDPTPIRGFFGIGLPEGAGPSGLRSTLNHVPRIIGSLFRSDPTALQKNMTGWREGLLNPMRQARWQSNPYRHAVADYANYNAPNATLMATRSPGEWMSSLRRGLGASGPAPTVGAPPPTTPRSSLFPGV